MYFVDKRKIEAILTYMEELLAAEMPPSEELSGKLAAERRAQLLIEGILDTGNSVIDGFIMRDPGSYDDIIDILADEQVIAEHTAPAFKEIIALRKMLTGDYLHVNHQKLAGTMAKHLDLLRLYVEWVRAYLVNETRTASAFARSSDDESL
ncbi:Uncharacterized conserved protein YutE, UPF0331/DUF86 family [Terribacillus halophilus]|uniref:Uncharacterized conserved protein YutE, UPF0331/DUF86 family n=1 Tax=Terribacillus halophilus TaxID=361279 RepID=A0A1G6JKF4_9BACI|nr:DUF86 domain-containing protein [Terribacillus halophilus]SDC18905.1 Uncharacterized conserved protein YutE, UPF0331/DUF86 family [Terribacillus halophilus]